MGFHHPPPLATAVQIEQSFHYQGTLAVSTSDVYRCRSKTVLVEALVSFTTAGTTATELVIYQNGAVVHTFSVAGTVEDHSESLDLPNTPDVDRWQVGITSVGAGANGLTVQLRWE